MPRFQNLVDGHLGEFFPHLCPGEHCAVLHWILTKLYRQSYGALKQK